MYEREEVVAIFVCPYSWSLFVGATSSSERQEVFRMQQSGCVHPGPVGLAHEVQLLPQLECSRQMQPPPAPPAHEQLMSGLLLGRQNSRWDPHGFLVRIHWEASIKYMRWEEGAKAVRIRVILLIEHSYS